jgi:hypothetical protein
MTFLWTLSQMMIVSQGRWSLLNLEWKKQSGLSEPVMAWPPTSPCKSLLQESPCPLTCARAGQGQGQECRDIYADASPRKRKENYAAACGCMRPQTSALISLLVWAMHGPEKSNNLCFCVRLHVPTSLGIAQKVGESMLMHVALCSH